MDAEDMARRLTSDERRRYQDPLKISKAIGIKRGMTVVDLGCGPGYFTIPLASLVGGRGRVYAVDANPTMLKRLRSNIKNWGGRAKTVKIIMADVSKTGIPTASADIVLLARILHDVEDKAPFLEEVSRICKPGARVINIDWKKARMGHGPPYQIRLSETKSKRILSKSGLRFIKSFGAGRYHYGLIMVKE